MSSPGDDRITTTPEGSFWRGVGFGLLFTGFGAVVIAGCCVAGVALTT